ncbi:MAG TPA: hypothetical protein VIK01_13340 [Polyangiaceae bacterium]
MSAELARRLIHSGAAPAQVEAALFEAVKRRVSLTKTVNDLYPELVPLLERALDRADFPAIHSVRPLPDLVRALPVGMCERLLALPVHRDPRGERIDVAAVDVLDAHLASEFAFHLKAPVRVLRASFTELTGTIENLHAAGIFPSGLSGALVELNDADLIGTPFATAPDETRIEISVTASQPEDDASNEPVLSLRRPKPFTVATSEAAGPPWAIEFEAAVADLETAESPEQVVAGLCEGLRPVRVLVFAIRNSNFEVRGGSFALGAPAELRALNVPSGNGSLLDATARVGFYFGPFAQLAALTELEGRWGVAPGGDCYARAVNVSERASLIVLMAGFSESTEATRRADVLARSAGAALERIVRARKKA